MNFNLQKNPSRVLALIVITGVLISGIVFLIFKPSGYEKINKNNDAQEITTSTAEILITASGFEPASIVVKPGTTVTWTNKDKVSHQIISSPHPEHNGLSELTSPLVNSDYTYEYTFNDAGSFGYHDEENPALSGVVEVQN